MAKSSRKIFFWCLSVAKSPPLQWLFTARKGGFLTGNSSCDRVIWLPAGPELGAGSVAGAASLIWTCEASSAECVGCDGRGLVSLIHVGRASSLRMVSFLGAFNSYTLSGFFIKPAGCYPRRYGALLLFFGFVHGNEAGCKEYDRDPATNGKRQSFN